MNRVAGTVNASMQYNASVAGKLNCCLEERLLESDSSSDGLKETLDSSLVQIDFSGHLELLLSEPVCGICLNVSIHHLENSSLGSRNVFTTDSYLGTYTVNRLIRRQWLRSLSHLHLLQRLFVDAVFDNNWF
jgi:hypothetical protein